jgi:hypothetical protein
MQPNPTYKSKATYGTKFLKFHSFAPILHILLLKILCKRISTERHSQNYKGIHSEMFHRRMDHNTVVEEQFHLFTVQIVFIFIDKSFFSVGPDQ